ncbi:hypothetical protein H4219_005574 [Mycoemilia scoparia]|uniref:Ion transport domain-containing protein n=1 Tax=Mycoemilia scoparia TaxID=417184 RepID=A0A9W8DP15_9FUNG|nr:hypothetical protein H4219_005574 [Mycoemilia scoparia]
MGKDFWKSPWNYFDILIVLFCLITLILLSKGCSPSYNSEELLNTILLVVRNAFQVFRLLATIRKNQRQASALDASIQFDDGSSRNPNILDDIEDIDTIVIDDGQGQFRSSSVIYDASEIQNPQDPAYLGLDRTDSRGSVASSVRSVSSGLTGRRRPNNGGD